MKTEFTPEEKALYEFMTFFSINEKDMVAKMLEWYPQASRDLEKQIGNMREMARLFRKPAPFQEQMGT
jgi:hypothetical protein